MTRDSDAPHERRTMDAQYVGALKNYETAIGHLQKQRYDKAKNLLEKLAAGGPAEVADRARVYLRLCDQKLRPASKPLKTFEDYYLAGVSELNARRLDRAIEYLGKAEKLDSKREECYYALAAAHALAGNADAALEHLSVSVRLRPQNRFQAQQDEDFQSLASDPRFASLLSAARNAPARSGA